MRKSVGRVTSRVETLETRELLSGLPVLTMDEYRDAVAEIREVMGTLAETGDLGEARADLAEVAAEIPFGATATPAEVAGRAADLRPARRRLGAGPPGAAPAGPRPGHPRRGGRRPVRGRRAGRDGLP